ncbi:MAG: glycoside hydrolase family 140 protein [Bacteroidota bacterium]
MRFTLFVISICLPLLSFCQSTPLPALKVSDNQRFLVQSDGTPFFWMADTAWELFHRCDREEAEMYLQKRASQGFNVIQAVALAEIDGLNTPNPYGEKPLIDNDPTQPNPKYFEHVDFIINRAAELGIYVALLPTWGDKLFKHSWGVGPEVFTPNNAKVFGQWIGNRYKNRTHIIWVIGGDRNPRPDSEDVEVWRKMAEGIAEAVGGNDKALMTFHPQPKDLGGSSTWFHQDEWLDFNMHQTGHCPNRGSYQLIRHDYSLTPTKPVLDGEPLYEDHPHCFNAKENGHSIPEDIRRVMYWHVFAGGFGQTYGCHAVWQMFTNDRKGINQPLRPWPKALDLPMANQVKHLKNLMLSRPFLSRIPFQEMVVTAQQDDESYVIATKDQNGSYAMVYFPTGQPTELDLSTLTGDNLDIWWYDTRTGAAFKSESIQKSNRWTATPPSSGKGQDWVLVVDDASSNFSKPGLPFSPK